MAEFLTRSLLEAAVRKGMADHQPLHEKWIAVQYRFGALAGPATLLPFAMNTRVDMLLRTLEAENLRRPTSADDVPGAPEFADDLIVSLSESWVSRCYELVRSARQRINERGETVSERFSHLLYQLELVRMPIDKAEIAKANRRKGDPIVMTLADGSDPREYAADRSSFKEACVAQPVQPCGGR